MRNTAAGSAQKRTGNKSKRKANTKHE